MQALAPAPAALGSPPWAGKGGCRQALTLPPPPQVSPAPLNGCHGEAEGIACDRGFRGGGHGSLEVVTRVWPGDTCRPWPRKVLEQVLLPPTPQGQQQWETPVTALPGGLVTSCEPPLPCKHPLSQHFPSRDTAHGDSLCHRHSHPPQHRTAAVRCDKPGPAFPPRELMEELRRREDVGDKLRTLERALCTYTHSGPRCFQTRATRNIPHCFPDLPNGGISGCISCKNSPGPQSRGRGWERECPPWDRQISAAFS